MNQPAHARPGPSGPVPAADCLRLGRRAVALRAGHPLLMGILNVSPESFSDGGRYSALEDQLLRAHELVEGGADLIDVGGESAVTDRPMISAEEEAERVVPLVERLAAEGVPVSVDTWKVPVARAAIAAGAVLVNDVSGLRNPLLADVCAAGGAGLVVMHTPAPPKQREFPGYGDVVADVRAFLHERLALARERGVEEERIFVDPGLDFGKTPAQSVAILRRLPELRALGRPILLAVSRKDFVGAITGRGPRHRLAGTLAALEAGLAAGGAVLRVHDVDEVADFLRVRAAIRGEAEVSERLRLDDRLRWDRSLEEDSEGPATRRA